MSYLEKLLVDRREDRKVELEYLEDIKDDFIDTYNNHIDRDGLNPCVNWFIHENDLYMTDEYLVENACHYLAIGAYLIYKDEIKELDKEILNRIKESYYLIKSGMYDKYFTEEDRKYIMEDVERIKQSNLF